MYETPAHLPAAETAVVVVVVDVVLVAEVVVVEALLVVVEDLVVPDDVEVVVGGGRVPLPEDDQNATVDWKPSRFWFWLMIPALLTASW